MLAHPLAIAADRLPPAARRAMAELLGWVALQRLGELLHPAPNQPHRRALAVEEALEHVATRVLPLVRRGVRPLRGEVEELAYQVLTCPGLPRRRRALHGFYADCSAAAADAGPDCAHPQREDER